MATTNTITGVEEKEQRTNEGLGQLKCKKVKLWHSAFLCIRRLMLTCIHREISTKLLGMPTHLDWSSLTDAGLSLMPTGHFCCQVSTANSPSASPVANWLLWVLLSNSLLRSLTHFRFRGDLDSKSFVWFRSKTDKGIVCLADHLHSVTFCQLNPNTKK